MSLFDRTVKLEFNEKKYALLNQKGGLTKPKLLLSSTLWTRLIFFSLGFCCMQTFLIFDVQV